MENDNGGRELEEKKGEPRLQLQMQQKNDVEHEYEH